MSIELILRVIYLNGLIQILYKIFKNNTIVLKINAILGCL